MAWNMDIVLALFIPVYGEGKTRGANSMRGKKRGGEALKRMIDETFTASKNAIVTRFPEMRGRIRAGELRH